MAGRKSLLLSDDGATIARAIIDALKSGATLKDASAMAGIGEATLHLWIGIGEAYNDERGHPRMPHEIKQREVYGNLALEIAKARTIARRLVLGNIRRAGQASWTHKETGEIVYTQPKPVTWTNKETGETSFEMPLEDVEQWEQELSGKVWHYDAGQWQANAWFMERSDPDNWGRTVKDVNIAGNEPLEIIVRYE